MTDNMDLKFVLKLRAKAHSLVREFFDERNFLSVETPIIVPTPGTETYLDYFSTEWIDFKEKSHRRYLRSSPELHLKQYLSKGLHHIYEIGPCFRNGGEKAKWHHPEFTMLEYYTTANSYHEFMTLTEKLVHHLRSGLLTFYPRLTEIPHPIPRLSVADAFFQATGIELIDQDKDLVKKAQAANFSSIHDGDDFESAFFKILLDKVEPYLASFQAVFLYDYPASQAALAKVERNVAERFELYLYGEEICNAFHELTDPKENLGRYDDTQLKRREIGKEAIDLDKNFVDALQEGLPTSCGCALGFDRLLAVLCQLESIDNVIPFRKNEIYSDT